MSLSRHHPPFFIVAVPRSGTTLLRILLDRHPEVAIPPESHFIPRLYARRGHYGRDGQVTRIEPLLDDLAADRWFKKWDLPLDLVRQELETLQHRSISETIDAVFRAYARREGKPRWGDKTPVYIEQVPLLAALFPDARFIHLVRDGRDVALSLLQWDPRYKGVASVAYDWARRIRKGKAAATQVGAARYLELKYEHLLEDPDATLRELCAFLELPFDPRTLQHDGQAMDRVPPGERRLFSRLTLPPTKGLRDWRAQMSPAEVAVFEAIAGPVLRQLQYEVATTAGAGARVRAWARVLWWKGWVVRRSIRKGLKRGTMQAVNLGSG